MTLERRSIRSLRNIMPDKEIQLFFIPYVGGSSCAVMGYSMPMISDYQLFFQYRFPEYRHKIRTDATVFYCEKDTAFEDVRA